MGSIIGHKVSIETRIKIGLANSKWKRTRKYRLKMSRIKKGCLLSQETKDKISKSNSREKKKVVCKNCGNWFLEHKSSKAKFCSFACRWENQRAENTFFGICKGCGKSFEKRTPGGQLIKGKRFCSNGCAPRTIKWRKNISESQKGIKSRLWQGGKTEKNKIIRRSIDFKLWREAVFKRDNFTCQECNIRGGNLHPHHIKSFAKYPKLRFALNNGITLCDKCHKKTPNYAKNVIYQ